MTQPSERDPVLSARTVTPAHAALTCDDARVPVWERLVVTIDAVLLIDTAGIVQGRWAQPKPEPPALPLYDALVIAGVPLTSDRTQAWAFGRPEWIELRVTATNDQVLAVIGDDEVPLTGNPADVVLDFYRRYLDDDTA